MYIIRYFGSDIDQITTSITTKRLLANFHRSLVYENSFYTVVQKYISIDSLID